MVGRTAGRFLSSTALRGSSARNESLMAAQPTSAVQDYLKTIHRLGGVDHFVSPAEIATRLGVRAPSVTGMLSAWQSPGGLNMSPAPGPV